MFQAPNSGLRVAFVIFWGILFYYGVPEGLLGPLDTRGKRIADELAEAKRLRQDAEALLKEFESKRAAAEREAAEIVSSARDEAERLAREAQEKMADFVKRRTRDRRGENRPGRGPGLRRGPRRRRSTPPSRPPSASCATRSPAPRPPRS